MPVAYSFSVNALLTESWPTSGKMFVARKADPEMRPDGVFQFTEKMLHGEPIPVYAEGGLRRDFTYIDDIVEGIVRLLPKPAAGESGEPHAIFNIGSCQPVRVIDFIAFLERMLDVKARLRFLPMQPGDMEATYADTTRLWESVGFSPVTSLERGLAAFSRWLGEWTA